jgi:hypothetical protein
VSHGDLRLNDKLNVADDDDSDGVSDAHDPVTIGRRRTLDDRTDRLIIALSPPGGIASQAHTGGCKDLRLLLA